MIDNMVDDKDNRVVSQVPPGPAWELPLLLLGAFRSLIDDAHVLLAERGHPDARPAFGFTLQAIGDGATASEIGERLGVSKQAAAKTVASLESLGYVDRVGDPHDSRRKTIRPTAHGRSFLAQSAEAFAEVVARWAEQTSQSDIHQVHATLSQLGLAGSARLDLGSWST